MTQPINNYLIGAKLREITQRSWDARLLDDVTPVIIANSDDLLITSEPSKKTVSAATQTASAATATIGTVPAGKVWRIICISCTHTGGQGTLSTSVVRINSAAVLAAVCSGPAGAQHGNVAQFNGSYETALIATAGQVVDLVATGANGTGYASIFYVEESA